MTTFSFQTTRLILSEVGATARIGADHLPGTGRFRWRDAGGGPDRQLQGAGPELGMTTRLAQVGVNHNHLPMLDEDAMKQQRLLVNNPREMSYEAALEIYGKAL